MDELHTLFIESLGLTAPFHLKSIDKARTALGTKIKSITFNIDIDNAYRPSR